MDKEEDKITYKQMIELGKKRWEVAMEGDVRMLIWLGKQYLGQSDNPMFSDEELCDGFEIRVIDSVCKECGNVTLADDGDAELKPVK